MTMHHNIHRLLRLGPPNQGSEVVDHIINTPGFELIGDPAGLQLCTYPSNVQYALGPVDFKPGLIAGC
jgi:hypothetical protein